MAAGSGDRRRGRRADRLVRDQRQGRVRDRGQRAARRRHRGGQYRADRRGALQRVPAAVRDRERPAAGGGGGQRDYGEEEDLTMHPITTVHYVALSAALLPIGTVGWLTRPTDVIILMSSE